jgi:hypothetical protein
VAEQLDELIPGEASAIGDALRGLVAPMLPGIERPRLLVLGPRDRPGGVRAIISGLRRVALHGGAASADARRTVILAHRLSIFAGLMSRCTTPSVG